MKANFNWTKTDFDEGEIILKVLKISKIIQRCKRVRPLRKKLSLRPIRGKSRLNMSPFGLKLWPDSLQGSLCLLSTPLWTDQSLKMPMEKPRYGKGSAMGSKHCSLSLKSSSRPLSSVGSWSFTLQHTFLPISQTILQLMALIRRS